MTVYTAPCEYLAEQCQLVAKALAAVGVPEWGPHPLLRIEAHFEGCKFRLCDVATPAAWVERGRRLGVIGRNRLEGTEGNHDIYVALRWKPSNRRPPYSKAVEDSLLDHHGLDDNARAYRDLFGK